MHWYRVIFKYSNKAVFLCFSARNFYCTGRLLKPVENDDSRHYVLKGKHLHRPDARKVGVKKVMSQVKNLARTTVLPPNQVIAASLQDVKKATAATLPSKNAMRETVYRIRFNPNFPANPRTLDDLNLTADFCTTPNGHNFLLYDSGVVNNKRMVIFGTQGNLDFLATCVEVYMDGTFSVTPPLFNQLYTIHGLYEIIILKKN